MYALQNFTSEEIFYQYMDPFLTPYILPLTQISLTGSVYSVIAVAVERYFNICKPFSRNLVILVNHKNKSKHQPNPRTNLKYFF